MKVLKSFLKTLIAVLIILLSANGFSHHPPVEKKLTAETNHSTLLFSVPIAGGLTKVTGKFNAYIIDIDLIDNDWTKSRIRANIAVNSIDTGIDGRDEHLRSADFFDVENYPEITFVSERIETTAEGFIAYGTFSMHGQSKNIKVPFIITGVDGENTIGLSSRLSIDRIDYGVGADFEHSAIDNFLADTINVEIDFWTKKRKEQ